VVLRLSHAQACADLWVFVDGAVRFRRREINGYNGGMPVAVPIKETDRFLTLVTIHGAGAGSPCCVFGDPRLEMVSAKASDLTPPRKAREHNGGN
jgi:hypothetical protein